MRWWSCACCRPWQPPSKLQRPPQERTSNRHGAQTEPSAAGDTVTPFETPLPDTWVDDLLEPEQFQVTGLVDDDGTWTCNVEPGYVLAIDPVLGAAPVMKYILATGAASYTVDSGTKIWCKVTTNVKDLAQTAEIIVATAVSDVHAQPDPDGVVGVYHYLIADFETVGTDLQIKTEYHRGGPINHRPSRNNRNLKMIIQHGGIVDGEFVITGSDTFLFFRQGLYVGKNRPRGRAAAR